MFLVEEQKAPTNLHVGTPYLGDSVPSNNTSGLYSRVSHSTPTSNLDFYTSLLSNAAVQPKTNTDTQSKCSPRPSDRISFSATKGKKVRQTLAAFQQHPPPFLFLGRPHVYYQQETSFTVKEVLLSNCPDVIH